MFLSRIISSTVMFVNIIYDFDIIYLQLAQFNQFECSFYEVQFESQGHSVTVRLLYMASRLNKLNSLAPVKS